MIAANVVTTTEDYVDVAAYALEPHIDYVSSIRLSADDALYLAAQLIAAATALKIQEQAS